MNRSAIIPLDQLPSGRRAVVRRLGGGGEFARRVAAMGLSVGVPLVMLQNRSQGPVLVLVRDTRIALGRGEAMRILVEEQQSDKHQGG